ncbi:MAG: choice-of-anchor Q domain-containing protein [Terracidiphilus sp.]|jgi:hypothetical protein
MKNPVTLQLPWVRRAAAAFAVTLLVSACASAATIFVAKSGTDDPGCGTTRDSACLTIQYAVNNSHPGDHISIEPGVYSELVTINQNLTLRGSKRKETIIDGAQSGTVVTINAGVTATIERLTVRNGNALFVGGQANAGGILNDGTLTLRKSVVTGNTNALPVGLNFGSQGGGIENGGVLTIDSSDITYNNGSAICSAGGGILNQGQLAITDSLIAYNTGGIIAGACVVDPGIPGITGGAGIYVEGGNATIDTTTILQNDISGGGFTISRSTLNESPIEAFHGIAVVNSTLYNSDIDAVFYDFGFDGYVEMSNSTMSGGEIVSDSYSFQFPPQPIGTIRNSILAGCGGTFASGDYNIVADSTDCELNGGAHDLFGVSPDLGPLGHHSGPTETMLPERGSAAIDGGDPAGCLDSNGNLITMDQRGLPRPNPAVGRCDIGAVQDERF